MSGLSETDRIRSRTATAARQAMETGWERAKQLQTYWNTTHDHKVTAGQTRNFLSHNVHYKELVDQGTYEKRDPKIRTMLEDFQRHLNNGQVRQSQGDPTQPARAGAPTRQKRRPKTQGDKLDLLLDLRTLAKEHNVTLTELQTLITKLEEITNL